MLIVSSVSVWFPKSQPFLWYCTAVSLHWVLFTCSTRLLFMRVAPPLDAHVSLTLRGADWSGWARAKSNKASAWKERRITRREKTGGFKNKREMQWKKESFYHTDIFEGLNPPPPVSLSLLMSPPLHQSILSWNNCNIHLEKTKAIVHLHAFTWHQLLHAATWI